MMLDWFIFVFLLFFGNIEAMILCLANKMSVGILITILILMVAIYGLMISIVMIKNRLDAN